MRVFLQCLCVHTRCVCGRGVCARHGLRTGEYAGWLWVCTGLPGGCVCTGCGAGEGVCRGCVHRAGCECVCAGAGGAVSVLRIAGNTRTHSHSHSFTHTHTLTPPVPEAPPTAAPRPPPRGISGAVVLLRAARLRQPADGLHFPGGSAGGGQPIGARAGRWPGYIRRRPTLCAPSSPGSGARRAGIAT